MRFRGLEITVFGDSFYLCRPTIGANVGLFLKNGRALVIDSGYRPDTGYEVIAYLDHILEAKPSLLFNTHYHSDHTFGNQAFACQIMSSEQCLEKMVEGPSTFWSADEIARAMADDHDLALAWKDLRITRPTKTFAGEHEYDFQGEKVIFKQLGGHTPDSSIVYFPRQSVAFVGDLIFNGHYPTLLKDGDPFVLIKALETIRGMHIDRIIPGHGDIAEDEVIDELDKYWRGMIIEVGKAIDSGLDDDSVFAEVMPTGHLYGIEFNEFKHHRNIESVMAYMRTNPRRSFNSHPIA
jgi:glyoxylase-like metal-dependent hydrolase (beta-lactamase superfamily II)